MASQLTLQDMHPLAVQVTVVPGSVVEVPSTVKVVDLGSPDAAASRRVRVGIDDLGRGRLQAFNGRSMRELEVRPLGRDEVVVAIEPRDLRITAAGVADGVGVGGSRAEEAEEPQ